MQEVMQPSALPDVSILAGQIRESSKWMYSRDIAAYAAYAACPPSASPARDGCAGPQPWPRPP